MRARPSDTLLRTEPAPERQHDLLYFGAYESCRTASSGDATSITTFTNRCGTTMTLTTSWPSIKARIFSSLRAAVRSSASETSGEASSARTQFSVYLNRNFEFVSLRANSAISLRPASGFQQPARYGPSAATSPRQRAARRARASAPAIPTPRARQTRPASDAVAGSASKALSFVEQLHQRRHDRVQMADSSKSLVTFAIVW